MADRYWDWAARAAGDGGVRAPSAAAVGRYLDAVAAATHGDADLRDPGNRAGACNCSDHCNGLGGSEQCRGNADGAAHGAGPPPRDGESLDATACNASTATYLDFCCHDPGDCAGCD